MEITVPYPKRVTRKPVLEPVIVECTTRGLFPVKVEAQVGCGIIFHIKTRSRIKIELAKPIDRPDLYRAPDDVPRSVERKVLAVVNSLFKTEFLAGLLDTEKGRESNVRLAEKIIETKKKTGRITKISQIFELQQMEAREFTAVITSLEKAYSQLMDPLRFRKV
jgi:hypothetical protein